MLITVGVILAELLRLSSQFMFSSKVIFSPVHLADEPLYLWVGALCTTSIFCTMVPIKIWNTKRSSIPPQINVFGTMILLVSITLAGIGVLVGRRREKALAAPS